ncbi:MAG: PEGA domain-containing protein [Deltaproteobacteria bacterium]|nr:PEGA domain-containing protein [Deltaproteobacteria bacterium]
MRTLSVSRVAASCALALAVAAWAAPSLAQPQPAKPAPRADDLARARTLDKEGAKAYEGGRYNDAIRYFEEAHRLGGPPFELWNIAKCHLRLDQPEQAADMLERYLATPNLPQEDRDEAARELAELKKRPSTMTIASTPSGARVAIDGKVVEGARTPTSTTVDAGPHTVTITLPGYASYSRDVDARYGRAIIFDAPLAKERRPAPQENPYGDGEVKRIAMRGTMGVVLPRYGSVGGSAQFGMALSGTYRFADVGATAFGVGGLVHFTGDAWQNSIGAPTTAAPCGELVDSTSAFAMSLFAIGTAGWELVPRLRLHAVGGLGLATYFVGTAGGDLFVPTCSASPGVRPALLLGSQLDFAVTEAVRLTALPIVLQLQPSFGDTRATPLDASGVWLRTTFAIGMGVDL